MVGLGEAIGLDMAIGQHMAIGQPMAIGRDMAIGQHMAIEGVSSSSSSSSQRLGLCLPPASAVGPVSPRSLVARPLVLRLLRLFGLLGPLENKRL